MELLRKPVDGIVVASERTIAWILGRQGLARSRPRKRPRDSYLRSERPGPMQLWGIDIVGGIWIVNTTTGVLRVAKVVTGVDDHSRFLLAATVGPGPTNELAWSVLRARPPPMGCPVSCSRTQRQAVTDRFGKHGPRKREVPFDKICRRNGIKHRPTQPTSPDQNGKRELLDDRRPVHVANLDDRRISVPGHDKPRLSG